MCYCRTIITTTPTFYIVSNQDDIKENGCKAFIFRKWGCLCLRRTNLYILDPLLYFSEGILQQQQEIQIINGVKDLSRSSVICTFLPHIMLTIYYIIKQLNF